MSNCISFWGNWRGTGRPLPKDQMYMSILSDIIQDNFEMAYFHGSMFWIYLISQNPFGSTVDINIKVILVTL